MGAEEIGTFATASHGFFVGLAAGAHDHSLFSFGFQKVNSRIVRHQILHFVTRQLRLLLADLK